MELRYALMSKALGSIYLPLVDSNRRDQPLLGLSEKKVFYVYNLALAAVELVSSDYGRLPPPSLGLETYIYRRGCASLLRIWKYSLYP